MIKNCVNRVNCFLFGHTWRYTKSKFTGYHSGFLRFTVTERCEVCGKIHKVYGHALSEEELINDWLIGERCGIESK